MRENRGILFLLCTGCAATALIHSKYVLDNFSPAKWIWLYLLSFVLVIHLILSRKRIHVPSGKGVAFALGAVVVSYLGAILLNFNQSYLTQFLDWSCFIIIALFSFNYLRSQRSIHWLTFFSSLAMLGVLMHPMLFSSGILYSTFGYPNMIAEFLGIVIILQTYSLLNTFDRPKIKIILILLLVINVSYLVFLATRATILGVYLMVPVLLIGQDKKKLLTLALIFNLSPIGVHFLRTNVLRDADLVRNKGQSASVRLVRWVNTLHLIKDNPFGIGPGNYEFGYIPYDHKYQQDPESHISSVVRSPHNGFLELLAENGIIASIIILLVFGWPMKKIIWSWQRSENIQIKYLSLAVIGFLLIDCFFAFPMENATPFIYAALFLGISLRGVTGERQVTSRFYFPVLMMFILFFSYGASDVIVAKFLEANRARYLGSVRDACRRMPENWRICVRQADIETYFKRYAAAEKTLAGILSRSPNNYLAIERMGGLKLRKGETSTACSYFKKHIDLMGENTPVSAQIKQFCR